MRLAFLISVHWHWPVAALRIRNKDEVVNLLAYQESPIRSGNEHSFEIDTHTSSTLKWRMGVSLR
jgi:hypothetical protein